MTTRQAGKERASALPDTKVSTIVLSERDWKVFSDALVNPPEPNDALRRAFASHRRLVARTDG